MFVGTCDFPRYLQMDQYSCGARSVYAICRHWGVSKSYGDVKEELGCTEDGVNVQPMVQFLRAQGFRVGYRPTMYMKDLKKTFEKGGVALIHVDGDHFVVVHGMSNKYIAIADPSFYRCPTRTISKKKFRRRWGYWGLAVFPPRET